MRFYLRGIKFCCEINQHAMVSFPTDNLSVRIKVGVAPQPRLLPPKWLIDFHATMHFFKQDISLLQFSYRRKIWTVRVSDRVLVTNGEIFRFYAFLRMLLLFFFATLCPVFRQKWIKVSTEVPGALKRKIAPLVTRPVCQARHMKKSYWCIDWLLRNIVWKNVVFWSCGGHIGSN